MPSENEVKNLLVEGLKLTTPKINDREAVVDNLKQVLDSTVENKDWRLVNVCMQTAYSCLFNKNLDKKQRDNVVSLYYQKAYLALLGNLKYEEFELDEDESNQFDAQSPMTMIAHKLEQQYGQDNMPLPVLMGLGEHQDTGLMQMQLYTLTKENPALADLNSLLDELDPQGAVE